MTIDTTLAHPTTDEPMPASLSINGEVVVYAALAIFSLLMRVVQLGAVPLSAPELPRAIAAWQFVYPVRDAPAYLADSAIMQLLQGGAFSGLGAGEYGARIATAIAGVLLVLSPLLFRDMLGRARTAVFSLFLALSPVLLATSRFSSPVIWETLLVIVGLWTLKQYITHGENGYALATAVLFAGSALLAGPTGHVSVLIAMTALPLPFIGRLMEVEGVQAQPHDEPWYMRWPWLPSLALSALVVVAVSTSLMLNLSGLNAVGQALENGLLGWVTPVTGGPQFFGLSASIFYELPMWIFGLAGVIHLSRRMRIQFIDAYLLALLLVTFVVSLFYVGTGAEHALWFAVPLAGLASCFVPSLFDEDGTAIWYGGLLTVDEMTEWDVPGWSKGIVAAVTVLIVSVVTLHLRTVARLTLLAGTLDAAFISARWSLLIALVLLLLLVFGSFTAASFIGSRATLRGIVIGLLASALWSSFGTGWQITKTAANNPVELWHATAVGPEVFLLRETLLELSERETDGFPQVPVVAVTDDTTVDAVVWALRDFENTTYSPTLAGARGAPIIIAPAIDLEPDFAGNYVGQTFVLTRRWDMSTLTLVGFPAWWLQQRTRVPAQPVGEVVLWLRQDIYAGLANQGER